MAHVLVEACVDTIESALAAQAGGAGRIELCANLIEGGTTPSAGTLSVCRDHLHIPVHVLIRPRGGDFLYSAAEQQVMERDIETARSLGADGIVIGALGTEGTVDVEVTQRLMRSGHDLSVTFHRAYDVTRDWKSAMEVLIQLGVDRVLTSGQGRTAPEGAATIAAMQAYAAGRIGILPGGGITPEAVAQLVESTGVAEVHLTGSVTRESTMQYRAPDVEIGNAPPRSEYEWSQTDAGLIREVVTKLEG